eukprot:8045919-Pyramimonas_sp.AAC.1
MPAGSPARSASASIASSRLTIAPSRRGGSSRSARKLARLAGRSLATRRIACAAETNTCGRANPSVVVFRRLYTSGSASLVLFNPTAVAVHSSVLSVPVLREEDTQRSAGATVL